MCPPHVSHPCLWRTERGRERSRETERRKAGLDDQAWADMDRLALAETSSMRERDNSRQTVRE